MAPGDVFIGCVTPEWDCHLRELDSGDFGYDKGVEVLLFRSKPVEVRVDDLPKERTPRWVAPEVSWREAWTPLSGDSVLVGGWIEDYDVRLYGDDGLIDELYEFGGRAYVASRCSDDIATLGVAGCEANLLTGASDAYVVGPLDFRPVCRFLPGGAEFSMEPGLYWWIEGGRRPPVLLDLRSSGIDLSHCHSAQYGAMRGLPMVSLKPMTDGLEGYVDWADSRGPGDPEHCPVSALAVAFAQFRAGSIRRSVPLIDLVTGRTAGINDRLAIVSLGGSAVTQGMTLTIFNGRGDDEVVVDSANTVFQTWLRGRVRVEARILEDWVLTAEAMLKPWGRLELSGTPVQFAGTSPDSSIDVQWSREGRVVRGGSCWLAMEGDRFRVVERFDSSIHNNVESLRVVTGFYAGGRPHWDATTCKVAVYRVSNVETLVCAIGYCTQGQVMKVAWQCDPWPVWAWNEEREEVRLVQPVFEK
jgi:hypothetical protein